MYQHNSNPVKFIVVIIILMVATFIVFWKGMGVSCLTAVPFDEEETVDESGTGSGSTTESVSTVTEE